MYPATTPSHHLSFHFLTPLTFRIVYGTNSGGKWWLNRTPLSVGVASVETCVSGNFFKGYPLVTMLAGPTIAKNFDAVKEVFHKKLYRHIEDESIVVRDNSDVVD